MKKLVCKMLLLVFSAALSFLTLGCTIGEINQNPAGMLFTFVKNDGGWKSGFADLPTDYDKEIFALDSKRTKIPMVGRNDAGLMLQGHNRSNDLFMYIAKEFNGLYGLKPYTTYQVNLSFELATNVAPGTLGIGGAPGTNVYVKAGVVNCKPGVIVDKNKDYRMNVDKGDQERGGKDMVMLGNLEKVNTTDSSYEYKSFQHTFEVTTDNNRAAWVIIGTDSGFEGLTRVYITNIRVTALEKSASQPQML